MASRHPSHARGQRPRELPCGERAVEPYLGDPDALAARLQEGDGFARGLPARAHHDDRALGLRVPAVVDQR